MTDSTQSTEKRNLVTAREVASMLEVSERTVVRAASRGDIPGAFKVGYQWRFNRKKIEALAGVGE